MSSPRSGALLLLPGLAAAIIFFALSRTAASGKSAVYDEAVHLLSGYRILTASDRDFNHEHPPLMKALAALPVVLEGAARPIDPWRYAREFDEWPLSHEWLYHVNDGDRLLSLGRLSIALAGACLVVLVFLAGLSLSGSGGIGAGGAPASSVAAASVAAALCATEPNLLAHGSLITTDMGMTLFFFAAVAAFERCLSSRGTPARIWSIATGALWGLGLLTKFTTILLAPAFLVMGAASIYLDRGSRPDREQAALDGVGGRGRGRTRRGEMRRNAEGAGPWRRLLVSFAIAAGVALLVLNAGYGFHGTLTPLAKMKLESESLRLTAKGTIGGIPLPVPASWMAGYDHAEAGGQRWWSYLMGMHSMTGWRGYYLVALLVKSSIPLLLLAAAGVVLRGTPAVNRRRLLLLLIPPAIMLAAFNLSGNLKNIGLRYILPVYPTLCLLGGLGAVALWRSWRSSGKVAAVLLLVWVGASEARIYPDHLAYFNEIAGGPDGGRWWLLDSNLDWGQDLKGLGAWMKSNGVAKIFLDYFGRACPRYYGIGTTRDFEGGYLAVSATNLEGVYREESGQYDFLKGVRPVTTIGHSILVYNVPRPADWRPQATAPPE